MWYFALLALRKNKCIFEHIGRCLHWVMLTKRLKENAEYTELTELGDFSSWCFFIFFFLILAQYFKIASVNEIK